jgi:hypothetical protein
MLFILNSAIEFRNAQISFGTIFWPKVKTQIEDLVDALLEKQLPFASVQKILDGLFDSTIPSSYAMPHHSRLFPMHCWRKLRLPALE